MGKKRWQAEQEAILSSILEYLKAYERVAFIGQEPYKSDFFRIFQNAFKDGFCGTTKRPWINGHTIWSYARRVGWVHAEMEPTEKRYEDIELVQMWWDEWSYAWYHNPPARRYKRKNRIVAPSSPGPLSVE